jgi:hypothetical protein
MKAEALSCPGDFIRISTLTATTEHKLLRYIYEKPGKVSLPSGVE